MPMLPARKRAAADQPRVRDRVVRRAEGARGDERRVGGEQAADRVDLGASAQWAPGASSKESGGRIVTIRFASILFPEPGGPASFLLWSQCLQALAIRLLPVRSRTVLPLRR